MTSLPPLTVFSISHPDRDEKTTVQAHGMQILQDGSIAFGVATHGADPSGNMALEITHIINARHWVEAKKSPLTAPGGNV